jgi:stage IV sporulation protein FB
MLFYEPPPTQADVHFRLFGFPVRVSPWFWIVALMFGVSGNSDPVMTLTWVVAAFLSILVHELGHAFLQRKFGGHPRVTLHGFGGLTICEDCDRSPGSQILISLAGPFAGFLFALLVVAVVRLSGHAIGFALSENQIDPRVAGARSVIIQPLVFVLAYFTTFDSNPLNHLVADLLQINILWGVLNLFPIYPLDGGRVSRELLTLGNPRRGVVASLWLSVFAAGVVAAYALWERWFVVILMFGYLAYLSYRTIAAYEQHWRGGQ